tara:strand:- start:5401 stop:5778 length:378 start_codon:yes stop_codon:yes gene_type:complete
MIVQTSTKSILKDTKKKTAISQEQFDSFVSNVSKGKCFDYFQKENKMPSEQAKKAIYKKAHSQVSSEYRVKGSRAGHINHAPVDIQNKYNQAKEILAGCNWSTDGIEYTCSLLAKKVVVTEVESK